MEGLLVNQHLGEATSLWIFGLLDGKPALIDRRSTPPPGGGSERWEEMAELLWDCSVILVSGIGLSPQSVLERTGIQVVVMEGMAKEGLEAVLTGKDIPKMLLRSPGRCGMGQQCRGNGMGCL
jgi:nitrogen fixation protein NifB